MTYPMQILSCKISTFSKYNVAPDVPIFAKNTDNFTEDNLSKDDWRELYQDEKKAKENCLTKEEYVRNFNEIPNLPSEQAFSDETVN